MHVHHISHLYTIELYTVAVWIGKALQIMFLEVTGIQVESDDQVECITYFQGYFRV